MPDGTRLNLGCTDGSSKHCEGFPSYPEKTQITCNSSVIAQTFYNTCTAIGPASDSIGFYEAERDGNKIMIYGPKWKRAYQRRGSWKTAIIPPYDYVLGRDTPQENAQAGQSRGNLEPSVSPSASSTLGTTAGIDAPLDPQAIADAIAGAKAGDAAAQSNLGILYADGKGLPQDFAQAAQWWRKSADQNNAVAQCGLGVLYYFGQGVPQSYAEAYFWLDLSVAGIKGPDKDKCEKNRDDSASKLSPAELSRVQERAAKWFTEHQAQP